MTAREAAVEIMAVLAQEDPKRLAKRHDGNKRFEQRLHEIEDVLEAYTAGLLTPLNIPE